MTISYSSTVIEDLTILVKFQLFYLTYTKRVTYILNVKKIQKVRNKALYYLNNLNDLKSCVETIKTSKDGNFEEYIFNKESKKNIENLSLNRYL